MADDTFFFILAFGPGSSAATALGATLRNNNVELEVLPVLVGGILLGFLNGFISRRSCLLNERQIQILILIQISTLILSPIVGALILGMSINLSSILIDELIGGLIIFGGIWFLCIPILLMKLINQNNAIRENAIVNAEAHPVYSIERDLEENEYISSEDASPCIEDDALAVVEVTSSDSSNANNIAVIEMEEEAKTVEKMFRISPQYIEANNSSNLLSYTETCSKAYPIKVARVV